MRRLPVYLLLDTSGSMKGEPIEAVRCGIQTLISTLRRDPQALETVFISIITFDREVKVVLPLTSLESLQIPEIEMPDSGPTMLGAALGVLCQQVDKEVILSSEKVKKVICKTVKSHLLWGLTATNVVKYLRNPNFQPCFLPAAADFRFRNRFLNC